MQKILVVHALKEEQVKLEKQGFIFIDCISKVGKVNASIAVQQAIYKHQPDLVLNIGTCGSVHHPVSSIHTIHTFVDRDMEKLVEFGLNDRLSFEEEVKSHQILKLWNYNSICNTGDTFLTAQDGTGDVFDMEGFAIAQVCKTLQLPFVAIKYVTDVIGQNSVKIWEEKLEDAQKALQYFVVELPFPAK